MLIKICEKEGKKNKWYKLGAIVKCRVKVNSIEIDNYHE